MSRDIEYSYKIPTQTDNGDQFGLVIEDFMERMANHTHNGDDSPVLNATIEKKTEIFTNWSPVSDGYEMTINTASGTSMSSKVIREFYLTNGADDADGWFTNATTLIRIHPTIVWSQTNVGGAYDKMTIKCNTNTYNLIVVTI